MIFYFKVEKASILKPLDTRVLVIKCYRQEGQYLSLNIVVSINTSRMVVMFCLNLKKEKSSGVG